MNSDFSRAVPRQFGNFILGAAVVVGLTALTALPATADDKTADVVAVTATPETTETASAELPSLGRHIRRAARLTFNVSLKFDDEDSTTLTAKRPNLARFVRARGHGSEATTVDGYGPDRLVESVTFPADAPLSNPRATALADVKDGKATTAPGL